MREHNLTGIETTMSILFLNENIRYKRKRLKRARIKFRNNSDTRRHKTEFRRHRDRVSTTLYPCRKRRRAQFHAQPLLTLSKTHSEALVYERTGEEGKEGKERLNLIHLLCMNKGRSITSSTEL